MKKTKANNNKKTNKRIQKCCGLGFLLERQKETPKVKMPHSMPWDRASLSQFIFQRLLRLYWWCDRTYMQSDRCLLYVCTSNKTNTILFCSLHWDFLYFFFFSFSFCLQESCAIGVNYKLIFFTESFFSSIRRIFA